MVRGRRLNNRLQERNLRRAFENVGIASDLFDVTANIDSTLTYGENLRGISESTGIRLGSQDRLSSRKADRVLKAQEIHNRRKPRAVFEDDRRQARTIFGADDLTAKNFKKWKRRPNRYDIEGVDGPGGFW